MMFIRDSVWGRIRDRFTEEEIAAINSVVEGRVICPAGGEVNIDRLEPALVNKLLDAMDEVTGGAARTAAR
jgi:hypothetical protein